LFHQEAFQFDAENSSDRRYLCLFVLLLSFTNVMLIVGLYGYSTLFAWFFETVLLCCPGWPLTYGPPVSISWILDYKCWDFRHVPPLYLAELSFFFFCGAGDWTQVLHM
jgi:hypothetical protein